MKFGKYLLLSSQIKLIIFLHDKDKASYSYIRVLSKVIFAKIAINWKNNTALRDFLHTL